VDNRRFVTIGGGILAAILVVTGVLYLVGGKNAPLGSGFFARITGGLSSVTQSLTPSQMAQAPYFAFRRLEVDTTKPQAEACLVFTRDLDASGRTHYEDYFSIDPVTKVASHVVGDRLCIAGLDFNATYQVTLKSGLPAAAGEKLTEDETVPVELRDKPSLVRFSGGIILPRDNTEGVPVTTVNITKLRLKIIRVGDRLCRRSKAARSTRPRSIPGRTATWRTARARWSGRARWTSPASRMIPSSRWSRSTTS
jgi:hypothetical protein